MGIPVDPRHATQWTGDRSWLGLGLAPALSGGLALEHHTEHAHWDDMIRTSRESRLQSTNQAPGITVDRNSRLDRQGRLLAPAMLPEFRHRKTLKGLADGLE